jgi:hypothetical protein
VVIGDAVDGDRDKEAFLDEGGRRIVLHPSREPYRKLW